MNPIRRHTATAHAAYHDLVSLLLDEAVSEIRGTPTLREREAKGYWYDRYRLGEAVHERYLGEDTDALRQRIERYQGLREERDARRSERARLVRVLRSEGYLGMDSATGSLINAMAKVGLFRLGGTLVGTHAFRAYEGELGIRLRLDQTAMTNDIDIASFEKLSLAIGETAFPSIEDTLRGFEFDPVPSVEPGKVWRWRQSRSQTLVEFLTPSFQDEEGLRPLHALGVTAQSLHFLNYLLFSPIFAAAIYRDGVLIRIPRPERYAIHKLIVSDRRKEGPDRLKSHKDLQQALVLISVLAEDRPTDLKEAYEVAMATGPQWRSRIEASLVRSPKAADLIRSVL